MKDLNIDEELIRLNQQGFIPCCTESFEEFKSRVKNCIDLSQQDDLFPFKKKEKASKEQLSNLFETAKKQWDISPEWISIYFSNKQLSFWHGGCAWIFEKDQKRGAIFQMRRSFQKSSKKVLKSEVFLHEISHVGRMMFDEPQFEEFLAYRTSSSWFRRWFGPLFQSWKESLIFIGFLFGITLSDTAYLLTLNPTFATIGNWTKITFGATLLLALFRLFKKHRIFNRCLKNLSHLLKDRKKAEKVIYRLTDNEILHFSKSQDILKYAEEKSLSSLRWRLIKAAYLTRT